VGVEGIQLGWALLAALLAALSNARLTRLVSRDEITRPIREAVLRRLNDEKPSHVRLAYLMECGWCTSVWWAAAHVGAGLLWLDQIWLWAALSVFALSQVAGMLGDVAYYLRNCRG
jgi:hypothetical protein